VDFPQRTTATGNSEEIKDTDNENIEAISNKNDKTDTEDLTSGRSEKEVVDGKENSLTVEQISKHPFVSMLMQQLEALEGRQSDAISNEHLGTAEELDSACDIVQETRSAHVSHEAEVSAHT